MTLITKGLMDNLLASRNGPHSEHYLFKKPTKRHLEILKLVAEGRNNIEIAGMLNISIKTVEKHRQTIYDLLNLHSTCEVVHYALATGLVENLFNADGTKKVKEQP